MKWIASGQRIQHGMPFELGKLWTSGCVVAKNGIDIEDAFIVIQLPSWGFGYSPCWDEERWFQRELRYTRSRGWEIWRSFS
jgi:hypothetical protein